MPYRPTKHRFVSRVMSARLVCLAACDDKADLSSDRLWESDHFRVHARKDDPEVCAGITAVLERHFAAMQAHLRFPWKADDRIDCYTFASRGLFRCWRWC